MKLIIALFIVAAAIGAQDSVPDICYDMMVQQCTREAANSPEGGFDVVYDQCVANWYASSGCRNNTPYPTDDARRKAPKAPKGPGK